MAVQICKRCGYEGKGKAGGPKRSYTVYKILGFVLMLPIYSIVKMFSSKGGRYCPHCEVPTMVKLKSDEGWIAKRKFEVRDGLVKVEEKKVETFGAEQPALRIEKAVDPDQW